MHQRQDYARKHAHAESSQCLLSESELESKRVEWKSLARASNINPLQRVERSHDETFASHVVSIILIL